MVNTFSLILAVVTGISGVFWCISKFCILMCNYEWYRFKIFFEKLENYSQQSKIVFLLLINFFKSVFSFISSLFPVLLLVFIIRSFVIEPFQIPSGSMMPTLLIGDFILVKKYVYGIKNPINQKMLIRVGSPQRGDVIVFKYPKDSTLDYIKRVVGKPGDKIIYNIVSKQLTIYPQDTNYMKILPIIYNNIIPSDFVQEFYTSKDGFVNMTFVELESHCQYNRSSNKGIRLTQTTELLDGIKYNILTMIPPGDKNFIKMYDKYTTHLVSEWIVPAGKYFVMGDNRDNSSDSRCWGYVPERNIVGQAMTIWMSLKKQEGKWPTGIRFNRIGSSIQ